MRFRSSMNLVLRALVDYLRHYVTHSGIRLCDLFMGINDTMSKPRILFLLLLMAPVFTATTFAQGFPWDDFKRRTLQEIIRIDDKEINNSAYENRVIFHADPLLSVSRVKYTGKSRPISDVKKDFL